MKARRFALQIAFALADATLLTPVVAFLIPLPILTRPGAIAAIAAVLLGLSLLWRRLDRHDFGPRRQYVVLAIVLAALTILAETDMAVSRPGFAPELIMMLPGSMAAALVWWFGASLGRCDLTFSDATRRLQLGALVLVIYGMVSFFIPGNRLLDSVVPFFGAATFALPLAHLESVAQSDIGRPTPMNRGWWAWSAAVTAVAMLAGVLVLSLVTGTPLVYVIIGLLALLALPLALLLAALLPLLINRLAPAIADLRFGIPLPVLPDQEQVEGPLSKLHIPPQVNFLIAVLFIVLAGAVLLVLMGHARRSREAAQRAREEDDFEVAEPRGLIDAVASARNIFSLRRWLAAITIRRLYARMTHEAGRRGQVRLAAETPYDYLPRVRIAFPASAEDARLLTDAYVAAHYGEVPDSADALRRLREAWERMRALRPDAQPVSA